MDTVYAGIARLKIIAPERDYVLHFKEALTEYLYAKLKMSNALPEEMIRVVTATDSTTGSDLQHLLHECDMMLYSAIAPDNEIKDRLLSLLDTVVKKIDQFS